MTTKLSRNGIRQPQELNASVGHVVRERQEDRRGQDLPGLHALQREAGEEAAPAERRVLENHRAGAGDLAGHREALDEAQHDEQHRGEQADLLRRSAAGRRPSSRSPSGTCTRSAPSCGRGCRPSARGRRRRSAARRSRRRRSPATRRWRPSDPSMGKKICGKDQRRRRGVDEEVVVLQRRADPAAGGRLLGLVPAVRLVYDSASHSVLLWR